MSGRDSPSGITDDGLDIGAALMDGGQAVASVGTHPDLAPHDLAHLDPDESDDASIIAELQTSANRKSKSAQGTGAAKRKSGGFQTFGLNPHLLKAITRKGFTVPTPIQRKTIPLLLNRQDVVGMARTGSGKTAAFVLPMVERLKTHSVKIGIRALIMSPSRELALQTLKITKEFARGTNLRVVLLVGGDSLDEQFQAVASNPDIVIATPGRFLHLKVEMGLDLSSVQYVVFDEADRLFEMGFAAQLTEILHALPASRQTALFSATLPKSLVEFAKAGLQEPHLVRLDAESKISQDLQSAFFTVKSAEKEGALLHILHDVIKMPVGETSLAHTQRGSEGSTNKKRKRDKADQPKPTECPTKHSTIIFVATKHHVEYIATILRETGFAVSHAYGSLDQTARRIQVQNFRSGMTNILVVTDVAARGIDIPVLANVINYDFPAQPKIFVHRVGRTARAGQKGWSYSLVRESDTPYLLDLQLFLGKKLVIGQSTAGEPSFADDVVVGGFVRSGLEHHCEWVDKLLEEDCEVAALRSVAVKGEKLYLRTRNAASVESARRARQTVSSEHWTNVHALFAGDDNGNTGMFEEMLARVSGFKPQETIFEVGARGAGGEAVEIMKKRRLMLDKARQKQTRQATDLSDPTPSHTNGVSTHDDEAVSSDEQAEALSHFPYGDADQDVDMSSASSDELEVTFSNNADPRKRKSDGFKDDSFFMSYQPMRHNLAEDRGYGVHSGGTSGNTHFVAAAQSATMDLANDDGAQGLAEPSSKARMRWDKKSKKYVARVNDEDGSKGTKYIRGESGQKIAATFRSGRFDAWRKANKVKGPPRVGEMESANSRGPPHMGGSSKRWQHKKEDAPKDADKYRDDFYKQKKRVDAAKEARRGKYREGTGKNEIKSVEAVRKDRRAKEKKREKTARGRKRPT